MKPHQLVVASLFHYWRLNLAVLAGVALTSAILSGALVVGDSVKESLRKNAAARISRAGPVLTGNDRFFTQGLASRTRDSLDVGAVVAPLLQVDGTVSVQGGGRHLNSVQVIGVTSDFWKLGEIGQAPLGIGEKERWFAINETAARRLEVGIGDRVIVRVEVPGALSRDAPLSGESEQTVPLTGTIDAIAGRSHFGRYSLKAEQIPPATVFLPLEILQQTLNKPGRVNVLLGAAALDLADFRSAIQRGWTLADAELHLAKTGPDRNLWQLSSSRVFLAADLVEKAAAAAGVSADPVLTYLVNAFRAGGKMTPYSMVAASGTANNGIVPVNLGDHEIVVTDWLAQDLGLRVGDPVRLEYFVVGGGRRLSEESSEFTVRGMVPLAHPEIDQSWTPEFPGVLEVDTMDQWEPGIPIDHDRIRKKDDEYWQEHRATPKAWIGIGAGRALWANRFGNATSLRFSASQSSEADFETGLKGLLTFADLGWSLRDLPSEAAEAVDGSLDFGQLFAYMSFFLIVAALILTGLVFVFGIEQRAGQIGLLMALGMPAKRIRRLFLVEAVVLAAIGAGAGLAGGWIYTWLALLGMSNAWRAAAAGIEFVYHVRPASLAMAFGITVLMAVGVVWVASRLVTRVRASHLIAGGDAIRPWDTGPKPVAKTWSFRIGAASLLSGLVFLLAPKAPGTMAEQGFFFGAGFLLTIAGVCACALGLRRMEGAGKAIESLGALGRQNSVRRKGRSLAVIGLMAAGVFMVTAINSFRLEGERGAERRSAGTGGFAYVGTSTLAVYEDLDSTEGREKYGLQTVEPECEWTVLSFRVSDGDDASCLNLNRAQRPRLLGVDAARIAKLNPFAFSSSLVESGTGGWKQLAQTLADDAEGIPVVPGVIDMNTATYALQKKLGDVVEYASAGGEPFRVKLVGLLETSLLQGSIVIPESAFIRFFPDSGGYRYFLLDAQPRERAGAVAETLTRMLGDRGMEMIPAGRRLDEFNAVQNTYLSIFSTLGGLGLLLGTIGLAVVVGRNVMERRGQLGLMQAVGFPRRSLSRLVLSEHWFLHVLGVILGTSAAAVAVAPKIFSRSSDLPVGLLAGLNGAVLIGGLIFCGLAARSALRGPLMDALRSE